MAQTATNVLAALKRETTFNTPATSEDADRIRLLDSPGLKLSRSNIISGERRSDQLENIGRLGGKTVGGSYNTEVNPGGAFDLLIEDLVRGTWESPASVPAISTTTQVAAVSTPASPVYRSYTIEQYDVDIDQSELFTGVRLVSAEFNLQPNEMSQVAWTFMGADRQVLASEDSPHFTDPALTSGIPLIADDSVITYAGAPIAVLTGMTFTLQTDAAGQPVIGSFVTPDIYLNRHTISGQLSAVREDLAALEAFDSETEFALQGVLKAPGTGPVLTFGFVMPRVKIYDVDAPFSGGDAAKVETRQFRAHPPAGASNAITFYSSTETPVAV